MSYWRRRWQLNEENDNDTRESWNRKQEVHTAADSEAMIETTTEVESSPMMLTQIIPPNINKNNKGNDSGVDEQEDEYDSSISNSINSRRRLSSSSTSSSSSSSQSSLIIRTSQQFDLPAQPPPIFHMNPSSMTQISGRHLIWTIGEKFKLTPSTRVPGAKRASSDHCDDDYSNDNNDNDSSDKRRRIAEYGYPFDYTELDEFVDEYKKFVSYGYLHGQPTTFKYDSIYDELIYSKPETNYNKRFPSVSLDGVSCTGKTTQLSKFEAVGIKTFKVNSVMGNVRDYNVIPEVSVSYYINSLLSLLEARNIVLDRSLVANLAYQLTYYLMKHLDPKTSPYKPYALCEQYIRIHNLGAMHEHIQSLNTNTIILVDSDIDSVCERMLHRGSVTGSMGDLSRCAFPHYVTAQNCAFSYIAFKYNCFIIDLNYFRIKYDAKSMEEIQSEVSKYLWQVYNYLITDDKSSSSFKYPKGRLFEPSLPRRKQLFQAKLAISTR